MLAALYQQMCYVLPDDRLDSQLLYSLPRIFTHRHLVSIFAFNRAIRLRRDRAFASWVAGPLILLLLLLLLWLRGWRVGLLLHFLPLLGGLESLLDGGQKVVKSIRHSGLEKLWGELGSVSQWNEKK